MQRRFDRYSCLAVFLLTTLVFIFTRWLIFKGFKGSDDLHYALLASKLLKGEYNPFQPDDIYSGRILLIAWQAFIYHISGINVLSTQIGTILAVILSAYLAAFKILEIRNSKTVLLVSSLIYFNPVLTTSTLGILPDVYIMLAGILIVLLLKNSTGKSPGNSRLNGILIGILIAVSLLFKETILVFLPFVIFISVYKNEKGISTGLFALLSFGIMLILFGWIYYHFTGNVFFRITQMKSGNYYNHCSYDLLPFTYLLIRLTYGVWQDFIVKGFYPVVFAALILITKLISDKTFSLKDNKWAVSFVSLLFISLYFPFTFTTYQPLCADARQFLFLLPMGAVVSTELLFNDTERRKNLLHWAMSTGFILIVCMVSTLNKWQWMIYMLMFLYFLAFLILPASFLKLRYFCFSFILWLSILEHLFFLNSNWFKHFRHVSRKIHSGFYYFHDHDNMMHWKLLHGFDEKNYAFYNIGPPPFKVYNVYYRTLDTTDFHPGWFIVNEGYTASSKDFLKKIDSLEHKNYFSNKLIVGEVKAFFINSASQLREIKSIGSIPR